MRAYELRSFTGPDGLDLVERPDISELDDLVVVRVHAIGVNFPDLLMTKGDYQLKPDLPVVPGCEVAGVVEHAPVGCGWKPGDRVSAFTWTGGYAELAAVPLSSISRVPDGVDMVTAAAMIVNYQTVLFALSRRGNLRPGETALVMGAGGGIGSAGIQVARGLGARVIAGVADDEQVETAQAAGASDVIVLRKGFANRLKEITDGRGVDVVLDPLGDWIFDEALRALRPEGRLLVIGFAAGSIPSVKVNRLLLRNASVVGVAFGAFLDVEGDLVSRQAQTLNTMRQSGFVRPQIGRIYEFEELPVALTDLAAGRIRGKAVVEVRR